MKPFWINNFSQTVQNQHMYTNVGLSVLTHYFGCIFSSTAFDQVCHKQHFVHCPFRVSPYSTEYTRNIKNMPWMFCIFLEYEKHIFAQLVLPGSIRLFYANAWHNLEKYLLSFVSALKHASIVPVFSHVLAIILTYIYLRSCFGFLKPSKGP